jgi:hypothetical protein
MFPLTTIDFNRWSSSHLRLLWSSRPIAFSKRDHGASCHNPGNYTLNDLAGRSKLAQYEWQVNTLSREFVCANVRRAADRAWITVYIM